MHILINISEEIYNDIKEGFYTENIRNMARAIGNGTILKGHGKLGDLDKIAEEIDRYIDKEKLAFESRYDMGLNFALQKVINADVILEADKVEKKVVKINESRKDCKNDSNRRT